MFFGPVIIIVDIVVIIIIVTIIDVSSSSIIIIVIIRVRDEFRLTLHAAETLYESSIAFGNRSELIMMSMLVVRMMMMLLLTELQNVKIIHE